MRIATLSISVLLLVVLLGSLSCTDKNPSAPADRNHELAGRAERVDAQNGRIFLSDDKTEVLVKNNAKIYESTRDDVFVPIVITDVRPGDSLQLVGRYWVNPNAVFEADIVTVVTPDSVTPGGPVHFLDSLATVDLTSQTVTFYNHHFVGKVTPTTSFSGPWNQPLPPSLQNFTPGMWVMALGVAGPDSILLLDSLVWRDRPDTTNPTDTTPVGTPLAFRATIATVSDADSTVTFYDSPFSGVVTPLTYIQIRSFILCVGLEGCITPGMQVAVAGHAAGNWMMTLDSLIETPIPPDTTNPGDSAQWYSFDATLNLVSTADSIVGFDVFPYFGRVTADTYLGGEMLPPVTLDDFSAGMYVRITGYMDPGDADTGILILTYMAAHDFLPPDTGDTIIIPPDTGDTIVIPPDTSGMHPIHGLVYVSFSTLDSDSTRGIPLVVRVRMETEEQFACSHVPISFNLSIADSLAVFDLLGVPPYECFAYQPGPAVWEGDYAFFRPVALILFRYQGATDIYEVTRYPQGATVVRTILQNFTRLR